MHRDYKFKIGQRVKTLDPSVNEVVHGTVDDVIRDGVFVLFDGWADSVYYEKSQYNYLKNSKKKPKCQR